MSFGEIRTSRLVMRNWRETDRALFHEINSDAEVMAFFPFRRDRPQSDSLMDRLRKAINETGFGFYALQIAETEECIGFAGLALTNLESQFPKGSVEIGWRLARSHWAKGYVTEAALALLEHGFVERQLTEIVSFAVHDNHRSTAVMERIGMRRDRSSDFEHSSIPRSHPHLAQHVVYRMTREDWLADQKEKSGR